MAGNSGLLAFLLHQVRITRRLNFTPLPSMNVRLYMRKCPIHSCTKIRSPPFPFFLIELWSTIPLHLRPEGECKLRIDVTKADGYSSSIYSKILKTLLHTEERSINSNAITPLYKACVRGFSLHKRI